MKKNIPWLVLTAVVMMVLPWLAVTFVPAVSGMAALLAMFFCIDPLCSLLVGAAAGRDVKNMWVLPLAAALLFVAGAWCFLDFGDPDFFVYAIPYLALGYAAMYVSHLIRKRKKK